MRAYPYIGKSEQGYDYLVASSKAIYSYIIRSWMFEPEGFAPAFKNITRDYLQPSHGEVVSLEHAEFIIEICKSNGIEPANNYSAMCKEFSIYSDKLFFKHRIPQTRAKKITIPLPPKADKQELSGLLPESLNFRCVMVDVEWPQVGDEAITTSSSLVVILGIDGNTAWVRYKDKPHIYNSLSISNLSKPKTPEDELRDEITELVWKANDLWTSTKEIQQVSVQEFVATKIIEKYPQIKKV